MNLLEIGTERIEINLGKVIRKDYTTNHLQILEDQLILHYSAQELCFFSTDGDNVLLPVLVEWIKLMQHALNIPNDKICFVSVSPSLPQWCWIPFPLEAFEQVGTLLESTSINRDLDAAKFVGVLAGSRWSVARMRMCYEVDKAFPGDAFITHKMAKSLLSRLQQWYQQETTWYNNRKFNNDLLLGEFEVIDLNVAVREYPKIWNQFQIEIICETDEYQNQWFTEKTAKCLSTGKPFVLLSGQHSLKNLRHMGFTTFAKSIDESYDDCVLPAQRIRAIIDSLQTLYLAPNKTEIIAEMQEKARKNIDIYHNYVQSKIQLRTHSQSYNTGQTLLRYPRRAKLTVSNHNP
jgi:hypothetical protein